MQGVTYLTYASCPLCGGNSFTPFLESEDSLVSKESFVMLQCTSCSLVFTQGLPQESDAHRYYASDEYMPHQIGKKGLKMHCVHFVRRFIREPFKRRLLERASGVKKGTLLDIGCGTGEFPASMQRAGWEVMAIEPDAECRTYANAVLGVRTEPIDALHALQDASFDVVVIWHVLEHIYNFHETMAHASRVAKERGIVVIALVNHTCAEAAWYGPSWAGYEVPRHCTHFTPDTVAHLAAQHGLYISHLQPLPLDAMYLCLLSERMRGGPLVRAVFSGAMSALLSVFHPRKANSIVFVLRKAGSN